MWIVYFLMRKIINALKTDSTARSLFFVNMFIILIAIIEGWPAAKILIVYWAQSVVIGFYTFLKILICDRKSKFEIFKNMYVAIFFVFHYGLFHLVYFIFILTMFMIETNSDLNPLLSLGEIFSVGFIILLISLFLNHGFSFIKNKKEKKIKNLNKIFIEPYARIIPMHLTLMFGVILVMVGFGVVVLFVFSFIKLYMDLLAHIKKHSPTKNKVEKNIFSF